MLREVTCFLVALYCVLVMVAVAAAIDPDPQRWNDFIAAQQHPAWLVIHAFSLVFFTLYQTMAWFRLAPKAMPLQMGDTVVPPAAIVAAHYAAWGVVTVATLWIAGVF
jgi:fumarate reductase subunit C